MQRDARSRSLVGLAAAALAAAAACSGKADAPPLPVSPYGGSISVVAYPEHTYDYVYATFVTSAGLLDPSISFRDTCDFGSGTPAPTPPLTAHQVDVGPNIVATASVPAGVTITIPGNGTPGHIVYSADVAVPAPARFDLTLPGGFDVPHMELKDAIALPAAPVLSQEDAVLPTSGPIRIRWTSTHSDWVVLSFFGPNDLDPPVECYPRDDGSFTIPDDAASALPPYGYMTIAGIDIRFFYIDDRLAYSTGTALGYALDYHF